MVCENLICYTVIRDQFIILLSRKDRIFMLTIFIVSFSIAILFSFICSLAEAVLLSLNPIRLETLKSQGSSFASAWIRMKENIGRPIAAILILHIRGCF